MGSIIDLLRELDLRVFRALYGASGGVWGPLMVASTILGNFSSVVAFVPLVLFARTRRFALVLAVAASVQAALVWLVKIAVGRVRPWMAFHLPPPWGMPRDGSFPSGHAAGSFCLGAFVAVVALSDLTPRWRARVVAAISLTIAALVATSRVYLAAHYPSDVLAGAFLGGSVGVLGGRYYLSGPRENAGGPPSRAGHREAGFDT